MEYRAATVADINAITAFTTATFTWGDYVPDFIEDWIDDSQSAVMVATDETESVVAVGRCALLTPREAWLHAARVKKDRRGEGIAGQMAVVLTDWARNQGAQVARLLIEDTNTSSISHITKTNFRRVTTVHRGERHLTEPARPLNGDGGHRRRSPLAAREGTATDAEMVVASWASGEAGRDLRGLIVKDWSFHRLRTSDVEDAAREGMLWEIGGSWAIAREWDGVFEVLMVDGSATDGDDIIRALVDLAADRGAERFVAWVADRPWLVDALTASGCTVSANGIYAQPL
jgi:GNAT superfamily N-acetyltransferase